MWLGLSHWKLFFDIGAPRWHSSSAPAQVAHVVSVSPSQGIVYMFIRGMSP